MSSPAVQPGMPYAAMPVPPSWARPVAEKTAPAAESQRDRERQPPYRETVERAREATDLVRLSREAQALMDGRDSGEGRASETADRPGEMSPEEEQVLQDLRARDSEVRRHEQAHQTVGGELAGAASYTTVRGPDGQAYAIGGEVPIDASAEDDPEATIDKMERVKAAALAPAEPSGQDRAVAAMADAQKAAASAELRRQDREEAEAARTGALDDQGGAAEAVLASPFAPRADVFGPAARAYGTTQGYADTPDPADRLNLVA